jgi:hypothetical protein
VAAASDDQPATSSASSASATGTDVDAPSHQGKQSTRKKKAASPQSVSSTVEETSKSAEASAPPPVEKRAEAASQKTEPVEAHSVDKASPAPADKAPVESTSSAGINEDDPSDSDIDFDVPSTSEEMSNLTVKQLKSVCKMKQLSGYSKCRKAELVELLMQS